jgi:RNA polymerase sigma-70 factor (ECF subfamily)
MTPAAEIAPTDAELVARARSGDSEAYRLLFDRHRDRVAATCRRQLRCPSDIDDAVQESFMRAMVKLDQLKEPSHFGAWVCAIAVRICMDHHRVARRTVVLDLEDETHLAVEDSRARPDEVVESAEHSASIRASLLALGERDRQALYLRHVADAPVSAVATHLGLTEGSTRVLLTRARNRLRAATASIPLLVPLSWRQWLREHLPAATPALDAMAVIVAVTIVAGGAATLPPADAAEQDSAAAEPAVVVVSPAEKPADTDARPQRDARPKRERSSPPVRRPSRPAPAEAEIVDRSGVTVREGYPDDGEAEEAIDVTVITHDDETTLRLYADEVDEAARTAKAVTGVAP